jgi:hypothetical protein
VNVEDFSAEDPKEIAEAAANSILIGLMMKTS